MFEDFQDRIDEMVELHECLRSFLRKDLPSKKPFEIKHGDKIVNCLQKIEDWLLRANIATVIQDRLTKKMNGAKRWIKNWSQSVPLKAEIIIQKQVDRLPPTFLKELVYLMNISSSLRSDFDQITSAGEELILLNQEEQ